MGDYFQVFSTLNQKSKDINSISVELISFLQNDLKKLDEDFQHLLKAEKMTLAYEACLKEISRRNEFIRNFYSRYELIDEEVQRENLTRNQFLEKFGSVLPFKFVPGLGAILPKLPSKVKFQADFNLPNIQNYHSAIDNQMTQKPGRASFEEELHSHNFKSLAKRLDQHSHNLKKHKLFI